MKPKRIIWKEEWIEFLRENAWGRTNVEITALINARFGIKLTVQQVKDAKGFRRISSGLTGWYPDGHDGESRAKPIGSTREYGDGYVWIKTAEPNVWERHHHVIWAETHGPVPDGHTLVFLNQDKTDVRLENLWMVPRTVLIRMNQNKLTSDDPALTETGIRIAELMAAVGEKRRGLKDADGGAD